MPVEFERKIFITGGSLRVNLPAPICQALKLEDGDSLKIMLNDSQIVMEKAKKGRG